MLYELTCKKLFFSPIRRIRKYLFFHGFVDLELSFVCDFWMSKCRESLVLMSCAFFFCILNNSLFGRMG